MIAVRCTHCGGAIAAAPGRPEPRCLFCGSEALVPLDPDQQPEPPAGFVPFVVDHTRADDAFRAFARSSFWYPRALRDADLQLRRLLLPAWSWRGELETHWAGLESALHTRSGKRPVTGRDDARFAQVLVPASATLSQGELTALGAFDEGALTPLPADGDPGEPYEVSELSRVAARQRAVDEMARRHEASLRQAHGLLEINASSIPHELDGRPVLVPVWIGVYTWKDRPRRVLVHGLGARVVGDAPLDLPKIIAVIVLALAALAVLAALSSG